MCGATWAETLHVEKLVTEGSAELRVAAAHGMDAIRKAIDSCEQLTGDLRDAFIAFHAKETKNLLKSRYIGGATMVLKHPGTALHDKKSNHGGRWS